MPRHNFINRPSRMSAITKASKNTSWVFIWVFNLQLKRDIRGTETLNSAYLPAEGIIIVLSLADFSLITAL